MQKPILETWAEKVAEQWKILATLVGALLVVIAVIGLLNESRARREREGTNALYEAQIAARKSVAEKKPEQAEQAYQAVLEKHKGTRAAFEAQLQLGDLWMDSGNFDKAVSYYQQASTSGADAFSKLLAVYTVGIAKESAGKFDEAVKAYEEALSSAGSDFLRPEILMAQARCFEALNQGKKAIEIYKQVQEKYSTRAYYAGAASAFEKQLSSSTKNL